MAFQDWGAGRSGPGSNRSRAEFAALTSLLLVALALRLHHLDSESLWLDETFSVDLARGSWAYLFGKAVEDFHPPLYFILLKAWTAIAGASGWAARLFSVLASVGIVGVAYAAGRAFVDRRTGVIAALLLTVATFQIEFAQEARMYALLTLFGAASTLAFLRLGDNAPETSASDATGPLLTRASLAYILLTSCLIYTQAVGVFVVLAHGIVAVTTLGRRRDYRRTFERWITACLVIGLMFMAWFPIFARQFSAVQRGFWIGPPAAMDLPETFAVFAGSLRLAWILGVLSLFGLFAVRRRNSKEPFPVRRLLLAAWLLVPIAGPFLASIVGAPIFLPKYTIAASVPLTILAAAGVACLPRWISLAAVTAILALSVSLLSPFYSKARKDDWRGALADLEATAAPGDRVLPYPYFLQYPFDIYRVRRDIDVRYFPRHAAETTWPTLSVMFDELAGGAPRLWFVLMNYDARHDQLVAHLRARYVNVERRRRGHVDVYLAEGLTH